MCKLLLALLLMPALAWAQVVSQGAVPGVSYKAGTGGGSGGGGGGITSGTTTITSGLDTAICFDDAGVINCADAGLTFSKTPNTLTVGVPGADFVGTFAGPALSIGGKVGMYVSFWDGTQTVLDFISSMMSDSAASLSTYNDVGVDEESVLQLRTPSSGDSVILGAQGLGGTTDTTFYAHTGHMNTLSTGGLWISTPTAAAPIRFATGGSDPVTNLRLTIGGSGEFTITDLATTGAATGKTVVCADTAGRLYRSSSGVSCAN